MALVYLENSALVCFNNKNDLLYTINAEIYNNIV
jgi:hypothetical protein